MILPTQQTYGLAASNLMQSMLDDIEQRRKEDAEKHSQKPKVDPVIEAKISASVEAKRAREKIAEALFGQGQADINELRMDLIERLGKELGIDVEEAKSSYSLGSAFHDAIKDMDSATKWKLAKTIGLDDLNMSLDQFVASVKNPYGEENDRLKSALEKHAGGGSGLADTRKVLQRLEDVADPKTLTELKLGPQYADPTRVVDAETRAERRQDIANAEASQKLEDVQKAQDVIEERNDMLSGLPEGAAEAVGGLDAVDLIQVVAAAAEQIEVSDGMESGATDAGDAVSETDPASVAVDEADSEAVAGIMANQAQALQDEQAENALQRDILPVQIDDIGLYTLLKKFLPAAA